MGDRPLDRRASIGNSVVEQVPWEILELWLHVHHAVMGPLEVVLRSGELSPFSQVSG